MGNCCEEFINEYDIFQIIKEKKPKKNESIDLPNQTNYNAEINNLRESNTNKDNNSPLKLYISKKKLKLTIKQSKTFIEGKEYIINSLGLTDPKNNYNDGLTIFGDTNVIYK